MAIAYKILGQQGPSAVYPSTTSDLYTATGVQTVISTISITNTTATSAKAFIWVRQGGASISTTNALLYSSSIAANSVTAVTIGVTLAATDKITVGSGTANALTFQAFGSEIS